jgi:hypothetical protein
MSAFADLDELLSSEEDRYFAGDLFIEAEELISQLSEHEVSSLLSAWQARNSSWRNRFCQASAGIPQSVLVQLLWAALRSPDEPASVLDLMGRLPKEADHSSLCQALLEFSERLWQANPELQLRIQMSTWSCGLSSRLLKRLGFQSWREAGL